MASEWLIKAFREAYERQLSTNLAMVWFTGLTLLSRKALNWPVLRGWPLQYLWHVSKSHMINGAIATEPQSNSKNLQCGTLAAELSKWVDFFCEKIAADIKQLGKQLGRFILWHICHRVIQLSRFILWPQAVVTLLNEFDYNGWSGHAFFELPKQHGH